MTENVRAGRVVALAVTAASVPFLLAGVGVCRGSWGWVLPVVCLTSGVTLVATAWPARTLFAGALARFAYTPRSLWTLRVATVVTAPFAGIGPAGYALLALAQALAEREPAELKPAWRTALGTVLFGLGFVLAAGELHLTFPGDRVLWGVVSAATGLSAFWWLSGPSPAARRAIAGTVAFGLLLWFGFSASEVDQIVIAGVAGALLATIVFGPRWLRRSRATAAERARLARAEERAEVAGAVHDSVLQTLALIQSRADDPAEVRTLARAQERELRERLFGTADPTAHPASIGAALRAAAAEVEDAHRIKIDTVIVGDAPLDERSAALVAAAREALLNAVRHAAGAQVSLFAEVDGGRVAAYVRDRGPGFDAGSIPPDRRGVTDSIVARMVRHGGHAAVRTAPGGGCEVTLVLERRR